MKQTWWIVVNQNGQGNIEPSLGAIVTNDMVRADFDSREDAEAHAREADKAWPDLSPHRVMLVSETKRRKGKLTEDDVRAIRERYAAGEDQGSLAECFEVSKPNIYAVVTRRTWGHVG